VEAVITDFREAGGPGGVELAKCIVEVCDQPSAFKHLYALEMPVRDKIKTISTKMYGSDGVTYEKGVITKIRKIEEAGYGNLPVCMAKTQTSLSDNPKLTGCPKDFTITVTDCKVKTGAGFIVVYTGDVMTMPGLPKRPSAANIDITAEGVISGLF
jgi:formate--tetrahydrofolate ligase